MNKKTVLILGVALTLTASILVSFSMFHYPLFQVNSLILMYLVLLVVSGPGVSLSFWYYVNGSFHRQEKPEVPLVSEEKIFRDLDKDGVKNPDPVDAPLEPQIIEPVRSIVPILNPGDAIKAVMQNRVIEALQKCRVEVNISADMDLNGEFKDPKISVSFITPETKKPPIPTANQAEESKPSESELRKPRI